MFKSVHPDYTLFKSLRAGIFCIEGIIGVGKTTLGISIEKYLNSIGIPCKFYHEFVHKEFLDLYISDMPKYAFSFQMTMLMKRIEIYKEAEAFAKTGGVAIVDRSLSGDYSFAYMLKQKNIISDIEWNIYNTMIDLASLPTPTMCIFLKCDPKTALKRVEIRGNISEIQGYNLDYMTELVEAYGEVLALPISQNLNVKVINWNKSKDYSSDNLSPIKEILQIMI